MACVEVRVNVILSWGGQLHVMSLVDFFLYTGPSIYVHTGIG